MTVKTDELIPEHQFGFRHMHSTIEQTHRVVEKINEPYEKQHYCSADFLDIAKAFDGMLHTGLLYKLKQLLSTNYFVILKSYFLVKVETQHTKLFPINDGVPRGSILGPSLYPPFTAEIFQRASKPQYQHLLTALQS